MSQIVEKVHNFLDPRRDAEEGLALRFGVLGPNAEGEAGADGGDDGALLGWLGGVWRS